MHARKWIINGVLLCLSCVFFVLFFVCEAMAEAVPTEKWHYDTAQGFQHSAVAVGNIDNSPDGSQEIVIGNIDGKIYCFDEGGWVKWTRQTGGWVDSTAALADCDGDGTLEIFIGSRDGYLYGLNYQGVDLSMWGWPKYVDGNGQTGGVFSSPALGDIDGDGDKEVVVGGFKHYIWAWHYQGGVVAGWPFDNHDSVWSSPAIEDIDLDGRNDVVIGADCWSAPGWYPRGGLIWALDGNARPLKGWPKLTPQVIWSSPAIGDVDLDGFPDIVVGTGTYWTGVDGRKVYGLRYNGTDLPGWPVTTGDDVFSSPALGDVDSDGKLEAAVGCNDGGVYLIDDNGSIIWKKTKFPNENNLSSVVMGDVDGDGQIEIITGSYGHLMGWKANGSIYYESHINYVMMGCPGLADFDHDGLAEVLFGMGWQSGPGILMTWNETGSYTSPGFPWPVFRGNAANTASLPRIEPPDPVWTVISSWYLAEGYTDNDFEEYLLLMNPQNSTAQVHIRFQFASGKSAVKTLTVAPHSRQTVYVDEIASHHSVSIKVLSDKQIISERAMYFNYNGKAGGHDSIGAVTPATTWYLAEGFTGGSFDEYVLVQNPNATAANIKVTFMRQGGSFVERFYTLSGNTRFTIHVDEILPDDQVSTKVESTNEVGVIAERAMYFNYNGKDGGHDSIGVTSPSNTWYLAEGYTGGDFDTWVLIQNPNSQAANTTVTFMLPDGSTKVSSYTLAPNSRYTIHVDEIVPSSSVSTKVNSDVPVIVERAMYFDYNGKAGGHDSIGVTSPSNTWYLAEGYTGGDFDTWVLIQNPNSQAANTTVTFMLPDGSTKVSSYTLAPNSRYTIHVDEIVPSSSVSTKVNSDVPVIVERAMYFDYDGRQGGHDSIGYQVD